MSGYILPIKVNQDLKIFYDLTRRTREKTLGWLETLSSDVFTLQDDSFAYGSLSAIESHVATTYLWWVGTVGLNLQEVEIEANDVAALRQHFAEVDAVVLEALNTFTDIDAPFIWTSSSGQEIALSKRWLILHPITHEFHHKGQALALARALGYPHPGNPDTDLADP